MREGSLLLLVMTVGSIIVLVSALWIIWDYRKSKKLIIRAYEEKSELRTIIADAELMVNELNNFSDYIITRIDEKNSEADDFLARLDKTLTQVIPPDDVSEYGVNVVADIRADGSKAISAGVKRTSRRHKRTFKVSRSRWSFAGNQEKKPAVSPLVPYTEENQDSVVHEHVSERRKRRVDALRGNKKCANVFALASSGMNEAMIARSLGIGRGEVALILELGTARQ